MAITNVVHTLHHTSVSGNVITFNLNSVISFDSGVYGVTGHTVSCNTNYDALTPVVEIEIEQQGGGANPIDTDYLFDVTTDDVNRAVFIDVKIKEGGQEKHSEEGHRETNQSYAEGQGNRPIGQEMF